jgi:hypothetical protein
VSSHQQKAAEVILVGRAREVHKELGCGFLEAVYPVKSLRLSLVYYTYVLLSEKDGKFYLGFTRDLKLRFEEHKKKGVC